MASVDDVLKSMLEEMKKYEKEYNETTVQINTIVKEYSAKIDELQQQRLALQDEGNKKIDLLNARKEQLSGKHSSLFEQYKKFAGKEPDFSELEDKKEIKSETVKEEKQPEVKSTSKKQTAKKVEVKEDVKPTPKQEKVEKVDDGLSPDEIAKLTEIAGESKSDENKKPSVDKNGNEIPEYLQDAYTK